MTYTPAVDDLPLADFTEQLIYTSVLHGKNAIVTALRRPTSHSSARSLQQWIPFADADEAFHLQLSDLAPIPTFASTDILQDRHGCRYKHTVAENQTADTRRLFVGRREHDAALRLHLQLDELTGTAAYDQTGNNSGTLGSGIQFDNEGAIAQEIAPKIGANALIFSGSGRINIGSHASLDDAAPITIAFWWRYGGSTPAGHVLDLGQLQIFLSAAGVTLNQNCATTPGTWRLDWPVVLTSGTWYHIAVKYARASDASRPAWYFNAVAFDEGTEVSTPSGALTTDAASTKYVANNTANSSGLVGGLDDLRIYVRELASYEVSALHLLGSIHPA